MKCYATCYLNSNCLCERITAAAESLEKWYPRIFDKEKDTGTLVKCNPPHPACFYLDYCQYSRTMPMSSVVAHGKNKKGETKLEIETPKPVKVRTEETYDLDAGLVLKALGVNIPPSASIAPFMAAGSRRISIKVITERQADEHQPLIKK